MNHSVDPAYTIPESPGLLSGIASLVQTYQSYAWPLIPIPYLSSSRDTKNSKDSMNDSVVP